MMAKTREETKRIYVVVILLCFLQLAITATTTPTVPNNCPQKPKTCICDFDSDEIGVDNSGGNDQRTIGLAGATGALAGVLLTGSAVAAILHFRPGSIAPSMPGGGGMEVGNGGGGGISGSKGGGGISGSKGGGGGGGDGGGGGQGDGNVGGGKKGNHLRPDTTESEGSFGSQSPLTGRNNGSVRPFTGATTTSGYTNIYRHRLWNNERK